MKQRPSWQAESWGGSALDRRSIFKTELWRDTVGCKSPCGTNVLSFLPKAKQTSSDTILTPAGKKGKNSKTKTGLFLFKAIEIIGLSEEADVQISPLALKPIHFLQPLILSESCSLTVTQWYKVINSHPPLPLISPKYFYCSLILTHPGLSYTVFWRVAKESLGLPPMCQPTSLKMCICENIVKGAVFCFSIH